MNREQAHQYAEFINSLCESGDLSWDFLDSLDTDARQHVLENSSWLGKPGLSEQAFEEEYGGTSLLGFLDVIEEDHLFSYYSFVSRKIHV